MNRPPVRGEDEFVEEDDFVEEDEHDADIGWDDDGMPVDDGYDDDEEYEELAPPSSRRRKVVTVLLAVFATLALILGGVVFWVKGQLDPSGPPGAEVTVTVPLGSSTNAIADLLENAGVIEDAQMFRYYLRYKGADGFQAGDYVFRENSAAWDALSVLEGRPLPQPFLQFTVPEGLTLTEIVTRIGDQIEGFDPARLTELVTTAQIRPGLLPADVTFLEGFLFPDTYRIEPGDDELIALQQMAAQFDAVAAEVGLNEESAAAVGLTVYEVVIVASLIQEEFGIVEEMPNIARVIYNRLDTGETLGIDATVCYGLNKPCADLTRSDLEQDTPYNTRINRGLPPTPIAAPGREALLAALHPSDGPWIFYVRDPDASRTPEGGHFFTESIDEFNDVKAECEAAGLGCG